MDAAEVALEGCGGRRLTPRMECAVASGDTEGEGRAREKRGRQHPCIRARREGAAWVKERRG